MPESGSSRYLVHSVLRAAKILAAFRKEGEVLRLKDIVQRTGFNKVLCFRVLYTLHHCGFVEKVGENQYRVIAGMRPRQRHRIGYAGLGQDASFPREVASGLEKAAAAAGVELILFDNRYDGKTALRNADTMLREQVEVAIEFQSDEAVAPAIAAKFRDAGVPLIAIDVPHPGATFFGANNYEAGLLGGRHLGRWALDKWKGAVDEILMIGISRAGQVPGDRIRGMTQGLSESISGMESIPLHEIDGDGDFTTTLNRVKKFLLARKRRRILVGAANDPSALGASSAFRQSGLDDYCAVVSCNADPEGRIELRRPGTRLIGSVAFFPERYGAGLIRLALEIIAGKPTPPALFMRHQLLTPENVNHHYPNDGLLRVEELAPSRCLSATSGVA